MRRVLLLLCLAGAGCSDDAEICQGFAPWETSAYVLPFAAGSSHFVSGGNCETRAGGHLGVKKFGYDFDMPIGTSAMTHVRAIVLAWVGIAALELHRRNSMVLRIAWETNRRCGRHRSKSSDCSPRIRRIERGAASTGPRCGKRTSAVALAWPSCLPVGACRKPATSPTRR